MKLVELMRQNKLVYLTTEELAEKISLLSGSSVEDVKAEITQLIKEGDLYFNNANRISISADHGYYKAKLVLNKKGYGFAQVDGMPDFFIPAFNINGAFDGDDCLVEITNKKGKDNIEGKVIKVLARNTTHVVGTFIVGKSKNVVLPDDARLPQIRIFKGMQLTAKNNEKVWVQLDDYSEDSEALTGKIIEVLGVANSPKAEQLSIIRAHKLSEKFEESTLKQAQSINQTVCKSNYKNRKDFTELKTITIDGEDAKDFDDAISVECTDEGYTLYVHIADVSEYVKQDSAIDKEALKRGTSVYFPNQVIPMLPKELSNGICSLSEGKDRLTLSVVMHFDKKFNLTSSNIYESIIHSNHRMTYTEIGAILNEDKLLCEKYEDVLEEIKLFQKFSNAFKAERAKRGEIHFNLPEPFILENADGEIISIENRFPDEPHEIIESLMIKANEVVAEFGHNLKLPFVYRVHEKPDSEKVARLADILKSMGIANTLLVEGDEPIAYQKIMDKIAGTPNEKAISILTLRTMMKARYNPVCLGHFGIASTYYCHFTSPIRRYPDLMVHRVLKDYLNKVPLGELRDKYKGMVNRVSEQASATEKNADEAEREVDNYKKALYMTKFIGKQFDAIISGVQEYGLFVELENGIEGLLRVENLPFDDYEYKETGLCLVGSSHTYKLGDRIKVVVASSNPHTRQIDFDIASGGTLLDFAKDNSTRKLGQNLKQTKVSIMSLKGENQHSKHEEAKDDWVKLRKNKSNAYSKKITSKRMKSKR